MRLREWSWRGAMLAMLVAFPGGCAKKEVASPPQVASIEEPALLPASRTNPAREPGISTEPVVTTAIPAGCDMMPGENGEKQCFPPESFVAALCQDKYPGVALTMFRKDAPWKHAWVKIPEVMPQNPYDGPVTHAPLAFSEEVILLKFRPFEKIEGYSVEGPDRYDVLRLSGSCASLAVDEIRYRWAGPSRYGPLVWNWLEPGLQQALGGNDQVGKARDAQQTACRGRYMGGGDASCQKATDNLVLTIMKEVDAGVALPTPERTPQWVVE